MIRTVKFIQSIVSVTGVVLITWVVVRTSTLTSVFGVWLDEIDAFHSSPAKEEHVKEPVFSKESISRCIDQYQVCSRVMSKFGDGNEWIRDFKIYLLIGIMLFCVRLIHIEVPPVSKHD